MRLDSGEKGRGEEDDDDEETEEEERLVPTKWVLWGLGGSMVLGTVLVWWIFGEKGIKPWATVLAFLIGSVLGLLGCVHLLRRRIAPGLT